MKPARSKPVCSRAFCTTYRDASLGTACVRKDMGNYGAILKISAWAGLSHCLRSQGYGKLWCNTDDQCLSRTVPLFAFARIWETMVQYWRPVLEQDCPTACVRKDMGNYGAILKISTWAGLSHCLRSQGYGKLWCNTEDQCLSRTVPLLAFARLWESMVQYGSPVLDQHSSSKKTLM
jgi:hypothetical protein